MSDRSRLLVVDNDRGELQATCSVLRDEGYDVTRCEGSRKALQVLGEQPFDLLLCEFSMPGLDGAGLVGQATAIHPDLVAVLVTDRETADSAVEAMAGLVDYICKPFRMSEMRAVVTRSLDMGRLRVENARLLKAAAQSSSQLEAVSQELNTFAGRIAHDLQAVMQVIEGFASVLQREASPKLGDKEKHYLQRIVDTSSRGNRLVNDLLAFARLATLALEFQPVPLEQVLQRAQRSAELQTQGRSVEWTVGELPTVWGDPSLLEQVFVNLLSNALKYSRGRETARIRVEAFPCESGYDIRIEDNGAGFDPQYADRLFRPFERLHGSAEFEGNGMGLANVRRIIERHGGHVRAQSVPDEGAMFAFTLAAPAATAQLDPPPGGIPAPAPVATGVLRILVVDDDPTVLLSLRNMLEIDGHDVSTAAGGQIGIDAFEQSLREGAAFDAVITDFGMPHMDGREVARAVKAASPATLVVMLTGWGARVDAMEGWQQYVDNILSKPPRLAQMREALAEIRRAAPG